MNRKIKVIVFERYNKQEHNTNVSTPTPAVQEVRRYRVACEDIARKASAARWQGLNTYRRQRHFSFALSFVAVWTKESAKKVKQYNLDVLSNIR